MSYFDIKYTIKGTKEIKEIIGLEESEIKDYFHQLERMSISFNGELIFGIQDLTFLQVINKNYKYIEDGRYITTIDTQNGVDINADLYSMHENPIEKDVTNKFLFDYGIGGEDYKKKGKVILEGEVLYVDNIRFNLQGGFKLLDTFNLIQKAVGFYNKNYTFMIVSMAKKGKGNIKPSIYNY